MHYIVWWRRYRHITHYSYYLLSLSIFNNLSSLRLLYKYKYIIVKINPKQFAWVKRQHVCNLLAHISVDDLEFSLAYVDYSYWNLTGIFMSIDHGWKKECLPILVKILKLQMIKNNFASIRSRTHKKQGQRNERYVDSISLYNYWITIMEHPSYYLNA